MPQPTCAQNAHTNVECTETYDNCEPCTEPRINAPYCDCPAGQFDDGLTVPIVVINVLNAMKEMYVQLVLKEETTQTLLVKQDITII